MKLKSRLDLVAKKIPECDRVFDIGTDHAYIPIYLIRNNRCKKVIACDVREGPLIVANKNIRINHYTDKIETRLGYGLSPTDPTISDVIVFAGMGGKLISDLLEDGKQKAICCKKIIIQPNYAIELVRKWLYENGFGIVDEELCIEDQRIYNVIVAEYTGEQVFLDDIYYYIGKKLIEKRDGLLAKYINKKVQKFDTIIRDIDEYGNNKDKDINQIMTLRESFINIANIII